MTVAELIKELSKIDPSLEVGAGYPIVGQDKDHQESLCRVTGVYEFKPGWESWMGERFALIELHPEVVLG